MTDAPLNGEAKDALTEAAVITPSPLFQQIAALMTAASAARELVDFMEKADFKGGPEKTGRLAGELLGKLAAHLSRVDFAHGAEIVAGAAQACEMARGGVDIICSAFLVGMPQKSKNPGKRCFVAGQIGPEKKAMIFLDQKAAERLVADVTNCLDVLYPKRLINHTAPKLIM